MAYQKQQQTCYLLLMLSTSKLVQIQSMGEACIDHEVRRSNDGLGSWMSERSVACSYLVLITFITISLLWKRDRVSVARGGERGERTWCNMKWCKLEEWTEQKCWNKLVLITMFIYSMHNKCISTAPAECTVGHHVTNNMSYIDVTGVGAWFLLLHATDGDWLSSKIV